MNEPLPGPRVNTFSLCAVDPQTGESGVAVVSGHIAVGALVPYAEPGAGAVATQAVVCPRYGARGLELLRKGVSSEEALKRLTREDITITSEDPALIKLYNAENLVKEGVDFLRDKEYGRIFWFTHRIRQVGMVDRQGRAAVHSGPCIFQTVASVAKDGFCCQGNMLTGREGIEAMAAAYEQARKESRTMLRRLVAALLAAEKAGGGNKRGNRAASLLVVKEKGHWSGTDRFCDVRVDEDDDAIAKLVRMALKYEEG